ncbi:hypothetical protein HMPREF0183_2195 [Brevibacterium mcbrellneri ATCC 49030]|uniref:Transposase n=1 Tax=Brevibacterium mcbrellneri ATCC 49030 TaxID=585530 RepID=D4YQI5_9MICO|nr:hypothetical protein HMPREF0183_2195 [Brevibacterium mcbrellneri ATCC 49030]
MDGPEKWRILRLHVEDDIPLTTMAHDTGLGFRTLQRWHAGMSYHRHLSLKLTY